jgi:hypothetical protein
LVSDELPQESHIVVRYGTSAIGENGVHVHHDTRGATRTQGQFRKFFRDGLPCGLDRSPDGSAACGIGVATG